MGAEIVHQSGTNFILERNKKFPIVSGNRQYFLMGTAGGFAMWEVNPRGEMVPGSFAEFEVDSESRALLIDGTMVIARKTAMTN